MVPSTQPPATAVDRVQPVFDTLMDRYDEVVAALLADPRVASDPNDRRVRAYLDLFTADNVLAQGTIRHWASLGQQGLSHAPGPRGRMYDTSVLAVIPNGADEASFTTCSLVSVVVKDASGATVEAEGGASAGTVVAVRVDGQWKLRDLTSTSSPQCAPPGATR
ncbi:MAG: hypothetical protein AMXMBFR46_27610 [Acidimicrobiia bacterium]